MRFGESLRQFFCLGFLILCQALGKVLLFQSQPEKKSAGFYLFFTNGFVGKSKEGWDDLLTARACEEVCHLPPYGRICGGWDTAKSDADGEGPLEEEPSIVSQGSALFFKSQSPCASCCAHRVQTCHGPEESKGH